MKALEALQSLRSDIADLVQITEIRTIAADRLWMSPCYRQPCVAFHFTWKKDWPGVQKLLPRIESILHPFRARPHWGKLFTMPASELRPLYPKLDDFHSLLTDFDPTGKFRNAYVDRIIAC